jgi:hypothetical protein
MLTHESPDFSNCQVKSFFDSGEKCTLHNYTLKNKFTEIDLSLNESTGGLNIKGNFGMFWNGHNLNTSFIDFRKAIEYISESVNVDLFPASVEQLDHSSTVTTLFPPKIIIQNHFSLPQHETSEQQFGKYFTRKGIQVVKMYDVRKRMNQICKPKAFRQNVFSKFGIQDKTHLLRFEKKILNPKAYFKKAISIKDLLLPEFIKTCNNDLMHTYSNIKKAGGMRIPKNKRDLSTPVVILIAAMKAEAVYGFDLEELIYQTLSSFDKSILTKDDKGARRKQIKTYLKALKGEKKSEYDISEELKISLQQNT